MGGYGPITVSLTRLQESPVEAADDRPRPAQLMLRFTGVMKLTHGVRRGIDVFACKNTGQNHCEKGNPDHETDSFKHDMPRYRFVIGLPMRPSELTRVSAVCCRFRKMVSWGLKASF
jgi:hypothetical protein